MRLSRVPSWKPLLQPACDDCMEDQTGSVRIETGDDIAPSLILCHKCLSKLAVDIVNKLASGELT